MSYIESLNQAATASVQGGKVGEGKNDVLGKEDFLTLLVAQLKNQDPLNPDEPTEFTAQLAQFSSLEQLFNLNDSMEKVASSVDNSQKLSALSMIGKEVTYADANFDFDGEPVQVGYSLDDEATEVILHLRHEGAEIATLSGSELSKGDHYVTWNGLTADGQVAPTGSYTIVLEAKAASDSIAAAPLVRSVVTGVDLDGAAGGLLITKSGEVSLLDIKGVFEPDSGMAAVAGEGWTTIEWGGDPAEMSEDRDRTWWTKIHGDDYPYWHRKFPLPDWVDDSPRRLEFEFSDGTKFVVPDSTQMAMDADGPKYSPEEEGETDIRKQHPKIGAQLGANPDWVRVRTI